MKQEAGRMNQQAIQELADKALRYVLAHPQTVRLYWVNHRIAICEASEAVKMCAVPHVAACIVGAVADDKALEDMLNQIIDGG